MIISFFYGKVYIRFFHYLYSITLHIVKPLRLSEYYVLFKLNKSFYVICF